MQQAFSWTHQVTLYEVGILSVTAIGIQNAACTAIFP